MQAENENNLRQLREAKNLSISQVAAKLKLTTSAIEKLESSEFASLGAYTYVRGYLKNYADLLEVDAEKLIGLLPRKEMEVPLINTKSNVAKSVKFKRHSKNFASYAIGTFIFVAICFSGWFLLKNYPVSKKNEELIQIADNKTLEITPPANESENENADTANSDNYHYSSLIPSESVNSQQVQNNESETNTASSPDSLAIPPKDEVLSLGGDEEAIQNLSEVNDTLTAKYQIQVIATETSWVKVEHLNGNKLHNDLLNPGFVNLESDEKVHFRIGNKDNVRVVINGEEIDLSKYSRKNIADFNWPVDG